MAQEIDQTDEDVIAHAVDALNSEAVNAEATAALLGDVSPDVLEQHIDRISDALFLTDPAMAVRLLNRLPASFTKRHADTFVSYLNRTDDPGYAAGAFIAFKARNASRSQLVAWTLDKALWKWMRRTTNSAMEVVVRHLGPDWGALWADHVAVVYGAGRLSRRLHKLAEKLPNR